MKYLKNILILTAGILFMGGGCHPEEYHTFDAEKMEFRKYSFSGIGLVRDNPNDTIEIFYSNATEQEGVNEVLTAKFATDTIVGMNESWVAVEFGKKFGEQNVRFRPNYSKGQYFKICNHGESNIFYFIIPNPQTSEDKYRFGNIGDRDYGQIPDIVTEQDKRIYNMLYSNGAYTKEKIKEVAELFQSHDKTGNTLFQIYLGESINNDKYKEYGLIGLNRSSIPYGSVENTTKQNGTGFYYGIIYSEECMISSKDNGGIMLQRGETTCYEEEGCKG